MTKARDHNWIKANLTTKVIDGKTWILMTDDVYKALRENDFWRGWVKEIRRIGEDKE